MSRPVPTITLPLALAKVLMQAAYWPSITAELVEVLGENMNADLVEVRQDEIDAWLASIGGTLSPNFTSGRMLEAVQIAWEKNSRPGNVVTLPSRLA